MAKYRKVSVVIWNDKKFNQLSDDGQLLFLFILTHPHMTGVGGMRGSIEGLAAEKRWKVERLSKAFQEGLKKGLLMYDKDACCITLPNFIKHNPPESPNVVLGWGKAFELIPEGYLKDELIQHVKCYVEGMTEAFKKAFERLSKELPLSGTGTGTGTGTGIYSPESDPEPESLPPEKMFSEEALEISRFLADSILSRDHGYHALQGEKKEKAIKRWAEDIEKIERIDGRTWEQVWFMAKWVVNDSFWSTTILSGDKFRKKFSDLVVKVKADNPKGKSNKARHAAMLLEDMENDTDN